MSKSNVKNEATGSKVILFGNGQQASGAYYALTNYTPHEVVAFTLDQDYMKKKTFFDLPVIPFEEIEQAYPPDDHKMLVSISFRHVNKLRAEKYHQAKTKGYQLVSFISSNASIPRDVKVGENCRIGSRVVIGSFAEIGNNVCIGTGSIVGHHTVIKDHCFLAGAVAVAGSVTIEPYSFIGTNATIRDRVTIAKECVIGAGSVILQDTIEKGVYMAQPAERLPILSDDLPLG